MVKGHHTTQRDIARSHSSSISWCVHSKIGRIKWFWCDWSGLLWHNFTCLQHTNWYADFVSGYYLCQLVSNITMMNDNGVIRLQARLCSLHLRIQSIHWQFERSQMLWLPILLCLQLNGDQELNQILMLLCLNLQNQDHYHKGGRNWAVLRKLPVERLS